MLLGVNNLTRTTFGKRVTTLLLWAFTYQALLSPTVAVADLNMGYMMGIGAFRNLVMTIAMVNKSMRDAAENPMDEWRRQNVKIAVGLLPGAIVGLAQVFMEGQQLHDEDLAPIQALLGGFVDVNAPDNYKKFLISPDKRNIPKVGAGFPTVQAPDVPSGGRPEAAPGKGEAVAGVSTVGPIGKVAVDAAPPSPEIVNLAGAPEARKKTSAPKIGFDDDAGKTETAQAQTATQLGTGTDKTAGPVPTTISAGTAAGSTGTSAPATSLQEAARDLSSIEAKYDGAESGLKILSTRKTEAREGKEEEAFWKPTAAKAPAKAKDGRYTTDAKRHTQAAADYQLSIKPKYWRFNGMSLIGRMVALDASAE